jgi:hypothetical protein
LKKWFDDETNEAIVKQYKDKDVELNSEEDFEMHARSLLTMEDKSQFPLLIIFNEAHAMVATGNSEAVQ